MSRLLQICCLVTLACYVNSQSNLNQLIGQVYTPPPTDNKDTSGPGFDLTPTVNGTGSCSCVPYYLCKNNTIIKDGLGLIDIRIQGPCPISIEVCCGDSDRITEPEPTVRPPKDRPVGCGYVNPDGVGFRITGGTEGESQFGEFPWMVAILYEETVETETNKLNIYQCGGALIHPRVVITAAHCVTGRNLGKKFKIRAGEWDTQTKDEVIPHQDRDVVRVVTHEGFRAGTLYNDVALLILESPVTSAENVATICLPAKGVISESKSCYATGWGKDVFGAKGKYQVILKKVELPMVPHAQCQDSLRKTRLGVHFQLHNTFVCAGGEPGKDTCKGDGGSPLVCPVPGVKDRFQQMGIVAWGIGCGEGGTPGVYANIAALRDWIDAKMAQEQINPNEYSY